MPTASETAARKRAAAIKDAEFCSSLGRAIRAGNSGGAAVFRIAMIERATTREGVRLIDVSDIAVRQVGLGMGACAILAAIGRPDRSNRTVRAGGERLQLVYDNPRRYIYLDNGIVTALQD